MINLHLYLPCHGCHNLRLYARISKYSYITRLGALLALPPSPVEKCQTVAQYGIFTLNPSHLFVVMHIICSQIASAVIPIYLDAAIALAVLGLKLILW